MDPGGSPSEGSVLTIRAAVTSPERPRATPRSHYVRLDAFFLSDRIRTVTPTG